jgi:hypothetical protein
MIEPFSSKASSFKKKLSWIAILNKDIFKGWTSRVDPRLPHFKNSVMTCNLKKRYFKEWISLSHPCHLYFFQKCLHDLWFLKAIFNGWISLCHKGILSLKKLSWFGIFKKIFLKNEQVLLSGRGTGAREGKQASKQEGSVWLGQPGPKQLKKRVWLRKPGPKQLWRESDLGSQDINN